MRVNAFRLRLLFRWVSYECTLFLLPWTAWATSSPTSTPTQGESATSCKWCNPWAIQACVSVYPPTGRQTYLAKKKESLIASSKSPSERIPYATGEKKSFSLLICTSDTCGNRLWNRDINSCRNGHVHLAYRMTSHMFPDGPPSPPYLSRSPAAYAA